MKYMLPKATCPQCGQVRPWLIDNACTPCRHEGKSRLDYLIGTAHDSLTATVKFYSREYEIAGIVGLFSGGNDSTTLAHLFRDRVTHYGHANTGIGVEDTRQYVRDTCAAWGVPLMERYTEPGYGYEDLVTGEAKPKTEFAKYDRIWPGGFPGPAAHAMFFQKLKETPLRQMRNELVKSPRKQRVIFLAGRRAEESQRRTSRFEIGELTYIERVGSIVWVSPLLEWGKLDLNSYRKRFPDVPRNETADMLHMSGECLCGCYARNSELDEIRFWKPDTAAQIEDLEKRVEKAGLDIDPKTRKWGWCNGGQCASGLCNT